MWKTVLIDDNLQCQKVPRLCELFNKLCYEITGDKCKWGVNTELVIGLNKTIQR